MASATEDVDFLEDDHVLLSPADVEQLEAALNDTTTPPPAALVEQLEAALNDTTTPPPAALVELIKRIKHDHTTQQLNTMLSAAATATKSDFVLLQ